MNSGEFGTNELQSTNSITTKKQLARRILDRELGAQEGCRRKANQRLMAQVCSITFRHPYVADLTRA